MVARLAIAKFLDRMCLALWASGLWLRYTMLQNLITSFPWIAPTASTLAQSKERKGSNFAIWQPCLPFMLPTCSLLAPGLSQEGGAMILCLPFLLLSLSHPSSVVSFLPFSLLKHKKMAADDLGLSPTQPSSAAPSAAIISPSAYLRRSLAIPLSSCHPRRRRRRRRASQPVKRHNKVRLRGTSGQSQ